MSDGMPKTVFWELRESFISKLRNIPRFIILYLSLIIILLSLCIRAYCTSETVAVDHRDITAEYGEIVSFQITTRSGWFNRLVPATVKYNEALLPVTGGRPGGYSSLKTGFTILDRSFGWGTVETVYCLRARVMGSGRFGAGTVGFSDNSDLVLPQIRVPEPRLSSGDSIQFDFSLNKTPLMDDREPEISWLFYVFGIVIVIGGIGWFRYYSLPWQLLKREVARLEKQLDNKKGKPLTILVSAADLVRRTVSLMLNKELSAYTISEVAELVKEKDELLSYDTREGIVALIREINLVVYAGLAVSDEAARETIFSIKEFVDECMRSSKGC